jgi:hypothetical protein
MTTGALEIGLRARLWELNRRIARVETRSSGRNDREKILAVTELALLAYERRGIQARLDAAMAARRGLLWGARCWLNDELMLVEQRVEAWLLRH